MGHSSRIFERLPIKVQNRNGFDLSHINCGSALCGTLTPVLKRLLLPGSIYTLGAAIQVELPPIATSFFGRIDAHIEVFQVPCSILYGGWRQFISNQVATMFPSNQEYVSEVDDEGVPIASRSIQDEGGYLLPLIDLISDGQQSDLESEIDFLESTSYSLMDYLGFVVGDASRIRSFNIPPLNMLPFLAYHRICDVFYRNPQVTPTWFAVNPNVLSSTWNKKNVSLVWHSFYTANNLIDEEEGSDVASSHKFGTLAELTFPDGVSIFSLRQRPWARDYFTAGSVDPQQGKESVISKSLSGLAEDLELSIRAIRAANSLQKFLEANNYSMDYAGIQRAHFGVYPSDALQDEPLYLGRLVVPVYQKSVYATASSDTAETSSNPFADQIGSKSVNANFVGNGIICKKQKCNCWAYLMGIFSLVPHTMYNYGLDKDLMRNSIGDFPFPELQSVGMDSIKNQEIFLNDVTPDGDFAYLPRYSYEKYVSDQAHGLLRPGKSLDMFVLQRTFTSQPEFGTDFSLIPINALDSVFSVATSESGFSCWYEIYWVFKVAMPLAPHSIPTLGDISDTHTITTSQGGSRL